MVKGKTSSSFLSKYWSTLYRKLDKEYMALMFEEENV